MNEEYKVGDYIEPGYEGHNIFMDSKLYGLALDSVVFACVDVFVLFNNRVIVVKRSRDPHKDWWMFGGRMKTGEQINESARRLLLVEAGLDIEAERFRYLTTFAAAWKIRAHRPIHNGTHSVSIVVMVNLTDTEFIHIKLNDEYTGKKLVDVNDLINESYHDALNQCARAYVSTTTATT